MSVLSLEAIRCRVNTVIARHGAPLSPRPQTFYREKVCSPEPPISGCQTGRNPNTTTTQSIHRKGGVQGFRCQLKHGPRLVSFYGVSVEVCPLVSATPPDSIARRIMILSSIGGWVEKRPLERFSNLFMGLTM
jgi:hypothetical protein